MILHEVQEKHLTELLNLIMEDQGDYLSRQGLTATLLAASTRYKSIRDKLHDLQWQVENHVLVHNRNALPG